MTKKNLLVLKKVQDCLTLQKVPSEIKVFLILPNTYRVVATGEARIVLATLAFWTYKADLVKFRAINSSSDMIKCQNLLQA